MARGALIGIVLFALAARAEDTWKQHYERGSTLFDLAKYLEAAKEFEAAYELKQNPAFLFNIGQSYRLAGKDELAISFYKSYLRRMPDAGNKTEVEARIAELEKLVEQQKKAAAEPPHGTIAPAPAPAPAAPPPPPPPMRHFAVRAGFGASTGIFGVGVEWRPTFIGIVAGTGTYLGTFGITLGGINNEGGFYLDAVIVLNKPGLFGTSVTEGDPGISITAGWDFRLAPWLSLKLGAGWGHNPTWTDGKTHAFAFDLNIGPVF